MLFAELEKKLKKNGWYYYDLIGFHIQYKHKAKNEKITIPKYRGKAKKEILRVILKQIEQ